MLGELTKYTVAHDGTIHSTPDDSGMSGKTIFKSIPFAGATKMMCTNCHELLGQITDENIDHHSVYHPCVRRR